MKSDFPPPVPEIPVSIHKILLEVPLADLPGQNAQANNGLLRGRHGRCGARVGEYLEAIPE